MERTTVHMRTMYTYECLFVARLRVIHTYRLLLQALGDEDAAAAGVGGGAGANDAGGDAEIGNADAERAVLRVQQKLEGGWMGW